jgi:hypothetical protein
MSMERAWRVWLFGRAYIVLLCLVIVLGCMVRAAPGRYQPGNPYPAGTLGYDVSWPNCGATPPKDGTWGVVGATGGLSLHPPRCLLLEARWFKQVSLYANTGYPGGAYAMPYRLTPRHCSVYDSLCLAYNYGYAEGAYAANQAARVGVHADVWWVDVETANSWDNDPLVNRQSIQGTYDALRHAALAARIGVYSYPGQWDLITHRWRPGWPVWAATGSLTRSDAMAACKWASFTGGLVWLAQYTSGLDRNIVCPAR